MHVPRNANNFLETRKFGAPRLESFLTSSHGNTICAREKIRKHETKCIVFLMVVSNQDETDLLNLASVWLIIGLWGRIFGVLFSNPTNISWWLSAIISRRYSVGPVKWTRLIARYITSCYNCKSLKNNFLFMKNYGKLFVLSTLSLRSVQTARDAKSGFMRR